MQQSNRPLIIQVDVSNTNFDLVQAYFNRASNRVNLGSNFDHKFVPTFESMSRLGLKVSRAI